MIATQRASRTGGWPQIADLGLACRLDDGEAIAKWVGTGHYMSPEVVEHRSRDQRDDLFAYSMVVFELFSTVTRRSQ